jgi:hypothetical protein
MNILYWILLAMFMAPVSICGVWSSIVLWEMTDLVNARLPAEQHFPFFWNRSRFFELRRRYRELFPEGKHLRKLNILMILQIVSFAAAVLVFVVVGMAQR